MFWKKYAQLSDTELLKAASDWAEGDRRNTVELLVILVAMDDRDLPERKGHPTLFKFCVDVLKFGEAMAYWRIRSARAAKAHPRIADLLLEGAMNITTVTILAPYLTAENSDSLLDQAKGKTRREIEALIASLAPVDPRNDRVTTHGPMIVARAQWPAATATDTAASIPGQACAAPRDEIEALDAVRRRLHFDVGPDTAQLIERAREILRHKYPFASLEDIVREALNVLLDDKDFERQMDRPEVRRPSDPKSRTIPLWVRRAVWRRDEGKCAFIGDGGKACGERSWLEFDHVVAFARGGPSDDPANVRLLCRAHNNLEAGRAFPKTD